jgi:hypothetical protein
MKKLSLFAAMLVALIVAGCAIFKVTYNTIYHASNYAKLVDTSPVVEGGVSITLTPIDINEYLKPEYSAQFTILWGGDKAYTATRRTIINLFYKMLVYNVEIVNNTRNVLSFSDARIALILPDASEPIFALSKTEMDGWAQTNRLPCIAFEVTQINRAYSRVHLDLAQQAIQVATSEIISKKSILSRATEIMPGMKVKGYLVFPYDSEQVTSGTISFIDVRSNTDAAGSTTLKSRFDYKIAQERLFVKREYSQELKKYLPFVRISESEYTAAQQQKTSK